MTVKKKERKNYARVGKPDGRNIGKTLDSNDQNQVADQRFSLKECFKWSYDLRSYERNFCNCVEKPEKFRTSEFFRLLYAIAKIALITAKIIASLDFISAVHIWFISYTISSKECLAGGAQSRGLRKPGCCHCYLRFFGNIVVEGGNTTVATNTNRSTQDRHTWLSVLWMLVYDSYRDPAASFLLRYKIWFSTCWDDSVLCQVHVVLNRVVLLI